jgi:uncharacterized protein (TIGR03435 family)
MFLFRHPCGELLAVLAAASIVGLASTRAIAQAQAQQSQQQRPSFEVASIRAHDPNDRTIVNNYQPYPGGRFTATNCSPWMLIHYAFQLQPFQIPDEPVWIKSEHYDVDARPEDVHTNFDDTPLMLQGLLEDRFQLKYHWEIKEAPVYELVVVKAGKLPKSVVLGDCPRPPAQPNGIPTDAPCGDLANTPGHTKGYDLTASELAGSLSWLLSKPILDKTNLKGKYDVELQWTLESVEMRSGPSSEQDIPDIFTALQEQLGLKLQPAKGPVRMFVIDHIARPSDN